jgi:uncharacterized protein
MKLLKTLMVSFVTLGATVAIADHDSAAVNKSNCSKVANTTHPFVLILDRHDNIVESITQCAKDAKLMGATINGLGQLHDPVLAYFSSDAHAKPKMTKFNGYYELANLSGNVTNNAGNYYTHLHATLADSKFHGISGHLNAAKVGQTAEITITPLSAAFERNVDAKTGFGPIAH